MMFKIIEQNNLMEVIILPYNYRFLSGKIREVFGSQEKFSDAMKISPTTLSKKMNGIVPWKQLEIDRACNLLHLGHEYIPKLFFTL